MVDAVRDVDKAGRAGAAEPLEYGARLDPMTPSRGACTIEAHQATPDDWRAVRILTLQMLESAPQSFKTTYAQVVARTEREWRDKIAASPSTFVAFRDGAPVGMLRAGPDAGRPDGMEIKSVWVTPTDRRMGVIDVLIERQLDWLRERKFRAATLWHLESNIIMERVARRHGFIHTGRRENDPGYPEPIIEMSRGLG
ncbi:GNAT family N-acetyltransferase [Nocardia brasiliensis]|uniref:GNAT family N-acetyltransferase n=1 Tax=Nocardia brasiliensis TaxID=37326 RepID=UPI002454D0B2|nr:GNAT family N-acetyltransferase [Nocardia brasiliensis]